MVSQYQTYIPQCYCHNYDPPRIIFKNLQPYCAWCRMPWGAVASIDYEDNGFQPDPLPKRIAQAKKILEREKKVTFKE